MAYEIRLHLRNLRDIKALRLTKKILGAHIYERFGTENNSSHINHMLNHETEWEMLGLLATAEYRIVLPMYSGFGHKAFCSLYRGSKIILTRVFIFQSVRDKCLDYFWSKDIPLTWSEHDG